MDKLDEYTDVINRLVGETIRCTPKTWNDGTLSIEADGVRIDYRLKNAVQPERAVISETLRDLIDELYVRMSRNGEVWTAAQLTFRRDGREWKYDTSFVYPPKLAPQAAPKAAKRAWWKFGGA